MAMTLTLNYSADKGQDVTGTFCRTGDYSETRTADVLSAPSREMQPTVGMKATRQEADV